MGLDSGEMGERVKERKKGDGKRVISEVKRKNERLSDRLR